MYISRFLSPFSLRNRYFYLGLTKQFQVPQSTQDYFYIVPILANYEGQNLSFGEFETPKIAPFIIFAVFEVLKLLILTHIFNYDPNQSFKIQKNIFEKHLGHFVLPQKKTSNFFKPECFHTLIASNFFLIINKVI